MIIGNHDAMNMYGDLRYVDPREFQAYATSNSEELLEQSFDKYVKQVKRNTRKSKWPEFDKAYKQEWLREKPPGYVEHRKAWSTDGDMGQWVLSRNAVLKIGDNLFVHGGIGPNYARWSINKLNGEIRKYLKRPEHRGGSILESNDSPLWYRGLAENSGSKEEIHLNALLRKHKVKRIMLGHTVSLGVILPRFNGKVILTDVGLSRYYGDNLACLLIEGDKLTALYRDAKIELPNDTSPESLLPYLEKVSSRESDNNDLKYRIHKLKEQVAMEETTSP